MDKGESSLVHMAKHLPDTVMSPAVGVASIALDMALKYYDINTVQDGTLYERYKLEGKNIVPLHMDMVFDTAIQIEEHLMRSEKRIAGIMFAMLGEMSGDPAEDVPEDDSATALDPNKSES